MAPSTMTAVFASNQTFNPNIRKFEFENMRSLNSQRILDSKPQQIKSMTNIGINTHRVNLGKGLTQMTYGSMFSKPNTKRFRRTKI